MVIPLEGPSKKYFNPKTVLIYPQTFHPDQVRLVSVALDLFTSNPYLLELHPQRSKLKNEDPAGITAYHIHLIAVGRIPIYPISISITSGNWGAKEMKN